MTLESWEDPVAVVVLSSVVEVGTLRGHVVVLLDLALDVGQGLLPLRDGHVVVLENTHQVVLRGRPGLFRTLSAPALLVSAAFHLVRD